MKILCTGLKEIKSGKTTLGLSLINYLKIEGESVCGFKPKAGNNIWYHWNTVKNSLKEGTIYGLDVQKYYDACDGAIPITTLNPIHRLWVPESQHLVWEGIPNFLLDRITVNKKQYIIINTHCKYPVKKEYFNKVFINSEQITISTREELNQITNLYEKADEWALSVISEKFNSIICESYTDIGLPWTGITNLDYVFVVEPFKIYIYDGIRYLNAAKIVSSISIEQKTEEIIEPIKPIKCIEIPPFADKIIEKTTDYLRPYLKELF
jgi:predicted P-loop ATPase/GTPase